MGTPPVKSRHRFDETFGGEIDRVIDSLFLTIARHDATCNTRARLWRRTDLVIRQLRPCSNTQGVEETYTHRPPRPIKGPFSDADLSPIKIHIRADHPGTFHTTSDRLSR